jgi:gluconate 2-dehydrogenase subunit 3-like protein
MPNNSGPGNPLMSERKKLAKNNRRQWLQQSAAVLGAAFLPLPSAAQPTSAIALAQAKSATPRRGRFFTPAEYAQLEELSETIIPSDQHSGGAKAAKVADYIELLIGESVDSERQSLWREGLKLVNVMSQHRSGKSFVDSDPEDRNAVLQILSDNSELIELPEVRFFNELKHMTVRGYYTSKIGIHDELGYKGNKLLLEYVGCDEQQSDNT